MKMIVFDFETQVKCLYYSNREVLFSKGICNLDG